MKAFGIFFVIILITGISPANGGEYVIEQDENGIFIQTDADGSWYVEESGRFRIGDRGTYSITTDSGGYYIRTDRYGRFRIDMNETEQLEREIREFNQAQENLNREAETKVHIAGNQVLVPVTLRYHGKAVEAMLLLDTGTSMTVLHREIADRLGLKKEGSSFFQVVGGDIIPGHTGTIDSVEVGPHTKNHLTAGIIDNKGGPAFDFHGLLGMDFLREYHYRIDFKRQVIAWEP